MQGHNIPHTEEGKRNLKLAWQRRRLNGKGIGWNKGKKGVSDETRQKMIDSHKGHVHSETQKKKITESLKQSWKKKKGSDWEGGTKAERQERLAGRRKPKDCEICGGGGKICFDHDHRDGKFRGWICERCNFSIGHARDNAELLEAMARYLRDNLLK